MVPARYDVYDLEVVPDLFDREFLNRSGVTVLDSDLSGVRFHWLVAVTEVRALEMRGLPGIGVSPIELGEALWHEGYLDFTDPRNGKIYRTAVDEKRRE